jgi:hypothetical protein
MKKIVTVLAIVLFLVSCTHETTESPKGPIIPPPPKGGAFPTRNPADSVKIIDTTDRLIDAGSYDILTMN